MRDPGDPRWKGWAIGAGLVLLVAGIYGRSVGFDSVDFDDGEYVFANPNVLEGLSAKSVAWALTAFHSANWHPLTWVSHMLDIQLFGPWPGAHHLVSVAIHAINAVLLFFLLRSATSVFWPSAVVAALFAAHPINAESVACISQRKTVLSTLFLLLALLAYTAWIRRGGAARYLAVAVLLALGLLAKPALVCAPLLFLAFDFWPLRRGRPRLSEKIPFFALAAGSSVATILAQSKWKAMAESGNFPLGSRVTNALVSTVLYLRDAVWPVNLAAFYPHPASLNRPIGILAAAGAALLLIAITIVAFAARRTRPWLLFGWAWFLAALGPVVGIVQAGSQARADRYAYIPLIGIFVAAAWEIASRLPLSALARALSAAAAVLVLAAFSTVAWFQAGTWRNGETLWRRALAVTKDNWLASNNLGNYWLGHDDPGRALALFQAAARIKPDFEIAWYNEGVALATLSRPEEALAAYRESVRLDPSYADAWINLGFALANSGRVPEGARACETALALRPDDPLALYGAAAARAALGDSAAARAYLDRLDRADPKRASQLRAETGLTR